MEATYRLGNDMEAAFSRDFPHFYHRVRRLEDSVAAYFLTGNAHAFVRARLSRDGLPVFAAVSFEREAAERFERRVERALSKCGYATAAAQMPAPDFPVKIEAEFGDARGDFAFDFGGDEALAAFCSAVQAWATSAFRHRFSAGRGAVSVKKARGKGDNT